MQPVSAERSTATFPSLVQLCGAHSVVFMRLGRCYLGD